MSSNERARPCVLFVHELALMGRAVERVLDCHGFEVESVQGAAQARARLSQGGVDALVADIALPDDPGFALIDLARKAGVRTVILVAAVYRKTSYKRRPQRLYGADDYVEIHRLGDQLPQRLRERLGPSGSERSQSGAAAGPSAHDWVQGLGDEALNSGDGRGLAQVLVADLLLDNADAFSTSDAQGIRAKLNAQLGALNEIFVQVRPDLGDADRGRILGEALDELLNTSTTVERMSAQEG